MSDLKLWERAETETFHDDGFRLDPLLVRHLWSKNDDPWRRATGVYHPSALSMCPRKNFYCRTRVEPRAQLKPLTRLIFDTGHAVHAQLGAYFAEMFSGEEMQLEAVASVAEYDFYGHADMILFLSDASGVKRVIDFKTVNNNRYGKLVEPEVTQMGPNAGAVKPSHMTGYVWQLHAYMAAFDCPLGTLYYYNKDTSARIEFPVVFDRHVWRRIDDMYVDVEQAVISGDPPPRLDSTYWCDECEYVHVCQPAGVVPASERRPKD